MNVHLQRRNRGSGADGAADAASGRPCCGGGDCLVGRVEAPGHDSLRTAVKSKGPYRPGDRIFRAGDGFSTLYYLRAGAVKTEAITREGRLQITGFHFAGDLLGAECLGRAVYCSDSIALETTWLCAFPVPGLAGLCCSNQPLLQEILARMGRRMHANQMGWMLARNEKADQRVLFFLHDLMSRRATSGTTSDLRLELPMSKGDIANYLGLAPESLSRVLKRLEVQGLIRNGKRILHILDPDRLQAAVDL